jgi:hypothetical protein
MKFNIEVDMTPQEMRKVLGLPDVEAMQKAAMDKVQEKLFEALDDASNMENLVKQFLPMGVLGAEKMQDFVNMMTNMVPGASNRTSSEKKSSGQTGSDKKED